MAAFNAVAERHFVIAVAIAVVVGALVFLQVSSISLDRHGTLSRQYGAHPAVLASSAEFGAIGRVVSGFVSGVVGF